MIAETNISLKVPFNEKDQAKALGARWNADSKQWYVPQGMDSAPFEKWFTDSATATAIPIKAAAKPTTQAAADHSADGMDAINAKLRDAYELREVDEF
jgi:hypothetical protein